jgi:hypothetical protein
MRKLLVPVLALSLACSHGVTLPDLSRSAERFDEPDRAMEYYAMKRGIAPDTPTLQLYAAARAQMGRMPRYATNGDRELPRGGRRVEADDSTTGSVGSWSFLGPANLAGRTRVLYVHPSNPQLMYTAGSSGGVWRSTDGGANWQPISDVLATLTVNALAVDPHDPNVIYAGTGEGYFREEIRGTAVPLRGDGIFVTRNGGVSWRQLPATATVDFQWVNDLVISSHDANRMYAATRTGVWRSIDAGESWMRVVPTTVKGGCTDLAFRGNTDGDYLFAACGVLEQATVYRSTNAENDDPWTSVLADPGMSRTSLAIAPSNPSIVYALAASNNPGPYGTTQNLQAVYRSDRNGDPGSWTKQDTPDNPDKLSTLLLTNPISAMSSQCAGSQGIGTYVPMGWHCNVISVDPTNPNRLFAGGVDVFRSDDGGRNWGVTSFWWADDTHPSYVHADQHTITFDPGYDGHGNQRVYVTNDGGIYRTDNALSPMATANGACRPGDTQVQWQSLNHGYGTIQFYHGGVFPDGRRYMGGAQDNGTLLGNSALGTDHWSWLWGGDGGYVAIDPVNPLVLYAQSQNGALVKSSDGGNFFRSSGPGGGESEFLFIAPLLLDPNDHNRVWLGGRHLWRSDDGANHWSPASASVPSSAMVSAIAVAPGNAGRVVAGTNDGTLLRTENATTATGATTWTSVKPRGGFVSSLTFDPVNGDRLYATYAGFGGGAHVWTSADGGKNWSPLDGTADGALPDIPIHSMAIDPTRTDRLYLGTDLGIFVSTDSGQHWMVENSGFAAAITEWVMIAQGARGPAVYAFTHGRGAWRAELTSVPRRRITR